MMIIVEMGIWNRVFIMVQYYFLVVSGLEIRKLEFKFEFAIEFEFESRILRIVELDKFKQRVK